MGTAGLSTPHGAGSLESPCRGWLTRVIPGLDQDVQCTSARVHLAGRADAVQKPSPWFLVGSCAPCGLNEMCDRAL